MVKKKKKYVDLQKAGSPRLMEAELEQRLALRGTLDGSVMEDEIGERIDKLKEDTSVKELEEEIKEAKKKKKH